MVVWEEWLKNFLSGRCNYAGGGRRHNCTYNDLPLITPSASPSHTSVSSKSCFAGSETVRMESGQVKLISEVVIGDTVQTSDVWGEIGYSEVRAALDCTSPCNATKSRQIAFMMMMMICNVHRIVSHEFILTYASVSDCVTWHNFSLHPGGICAAQEEQVQDCLLPLSNREWTRHESDPRPLDRSGSMRHSIGILETSTQVC